MTNRVRRWAGWLVVVLLAVGLPPLQASASPIDPLQRTWMRTDQPVASGYLQRTWMWGPQETAYATDEPYAQSPNGEREVIYYDKSRMEVTQPDADPTASWYVTNGLLVVEMVDGRVQLGDADFDEDSSPADIPVAGDPGGGALTYAQIADFGLRGKSARAVGDPILEYVDAAGAIQSNDAYGNFGVTAAVVVNQPGIHHAVASVFWAFMDSSGSVYQDGQYTNAKLFESPYYATGYPITEAYWTSTTVGGTSQDVLWQCFERRCLTYTPANAPEWQVEAGNVGMHYYAWRYGSERPKPPTLSVIFNIVYQGAQVATITTNETFLGDTAVGTWTTVATDGSQVASGTLVADHPLGSVEADISQSWPFPGTATLAFTYGLSLGGVGGTGTLTWQTTAVTSPQSGTVNLTATSTDLTTWTIEVDALPPVFVGDVGVR